MKTSAPRTIALAVALGLTGSTLALAPAEAAGVRIQLEITGGATEEPTTDSGGPGPTDSPSGPSPGEPGSPSRPGGEGSPLPADPLPRTGTGAAVLALWGAAALAAGGAALRIRHHRTTSAPPVSTHQE